jgi:hypothetical protein
MEFGSREFINCVNALAYRVRTKYYNFRGSHPAGAYSKAELTQFTEGMHNLARGVSAHVLMEPTGTTEQPGHNPVTLELFRVDEPDPSFEMKSGGKVIGHVCVSQANAVTAVYYFCGAQNNLLGGCPRSNVEALKLRYNSNPTIMYGSRECEPTAREREAKHPNALQYFSPGWKCPDVSVGRG